MPKSHDMSVVKRGDILKRYEPEGEVVIIGGGWFGRDKIVGDYSHPRDWTKAYPEICARFPNKKKWYEWHGRVRDWDETEAFFRWSHLCWEADRDAAE